MCGIIITSGIDFERVREGIKALRHRGPDNQDLYLDEESGVVLGHTRLAIQDLSPGANQPMRSDCGRFSLVFNGEIYNFPELRTELEDKDYRFKTNSDSEVLLSLYMEFRGQVVRKLRGIFAFAVWDAQHQELFAARDAFGVKPLYFFEGEDSFVLASELKAIADVVSLPKDLDANSSYQYLVLGWSTGKGTPFRAVRRLGAGQYMRMQGGRVKELSSWYEFPGFMVQKEINDRRQAVNELTERFRCAVRNQLISDVPVGAFLSGGLDSSAIVAMASEMLPKIDCFTISISGGPDIGSQDDLPYAKMVAKHLDVPLHVIEVDSSNVAEDLVKMVYMLDEPQADPAALNVLYMSQLARRNGVKVLLSGVGGDDLFSGYRRHVAAQAETWWSKVPQRIRKNLSALVGSLDSHGSNIRRLKSFLRDPEQDPDIRIAGYFCQIAEGDGRRLFRKEFRERVSANAAIQPMLELFDTLPDEATYLKKMLVAEQRSFLPDHNLNYVDKMAMAAGVEVRVPFLDDDLVSFTWKLPDRLKAGRFTTKRLLRAAMRPYLPKSVLKRPKTGFGLPIRRWVRGELKGMIDTSLSRERLISRGIFDPDAVRDLIRGNSEGKVDGGYTLFAILCFELWCELFIDKRREYQTLYESTD